MQQRHMVHNFKAIYEWNCQLWYDERVGRLNAPERFLHPDINWCMPVMYTKLQNTHGVQLKCCIFLKISTMILYANTLCCFTFPELFLHMIFNWDMLELYINAPTTTNGAQFQSYRWIRLSTMICLESISFKCLRAVFAHRYHLGSACNVYKCTKHTCCTTSLL